MNTIHIDYLDSTNDYLKFKYRFLDDFTVISVDSQINGKGRKDRQWESEHKKNLLCSILLKDRTYIKHIESLSLMTGVVVFNLLNKLKVKNVSIKWPNDIYVNDKKICGILVESVSTGEKIEAAIIGIGLNLNQIKFSESLNATSYALETNKNIKVEKVLNKLLSLFKKELKKVCLDKSKYIEVINEHNYLLDKQGFVTINNAKEKVTIKDINIDNSLNVIFKEKTVAIKSDEVSFTDK